MKRHSGLFRERNSDVSWIYRIAGVFDLSDCAFVTSIHDANPADFAIWLASFRQSFLLPREDFVAVLVHQFTQDGVLAAKRVAGAVEINNVACHELGSVWSLQSTKNVV